MPDINKLLSAVTESPMLVVRKRTYASEIRELADIIAERNTITPRNPLLKDLPRVVEMALKRQDVDSIHALMDLASHVLGDVLFLNLLQNMAVAVGDDVSSGFDRLDQAFSGLKEPGIGWARWKISLYITTHVLVLLNFLPIITNFINSWCLNHTSHIEFLLQELYFDSILYSEMGIQANAVDWDIVLQELYYEKVNLGREVRDIVKDEKGDYHFPFTLSRLEPRVLFLSECVSQAVENRTYKVERYDGGYVAIVDLSSDELLRAVNERIRRYPMIQRAIELFEELRCKFAKTKVSVDDEDYLTWKNSKPYANFFTRGLERLKAGLKGVALRCVTALYSPYVYGSFNGVLQLVATGKTARIALDLARAVARQIRLTAPYARLFLDGVYALRLLKEGDFSRDDETRGMLERASRANFYPFLSPGFMVRHMRLFIAAQILKFANSLAEVAGYRQLIFEPTGDLQTDVKYWWRKSSLDSKADFMQDADEFVKHINHQSYRDFIEVLRRPHFELAPKVTEWSINPLGWGP